MLKPLFFNELFKFDIEEAAVLPNEVEKDLSLFKVVDSYNSDCFATVFLRL
jgi:hypothetical protein